MMSRVKEPPLRRLLNVSSIYGRGQVDSQVNFSTAKPYQRSKLTNMASSTKPEIQSANTPGPGCSYLRPELRDIKVIGVEEHVVYPSLTSRVPNEGLAVHARQIFSHMVGHEALAYARGRSTQVGAQRIQDMDGGGIAMQILSVAGPVNCTLMEAEAGLALARDINDELKKAVDAHPDRYKALAELPFHAPDLAIKELRRCVGDLGFVGAMLAGAVGQNSQFLDDAVFDDLLSEFEALNVPLFLHPGIAPPAVVESYYQFPGKPKLSATLAGMGWGWHNEVAIHVLRLAVSGTLDRHPNLKIVVGHQGEMLPMMLQRFDAMFDEQVFGLKRSVAETLRSQVWLAISGLFSLPPTQIAIQTWGVDRILFANDYPFIDATRVPDYLRALGDVVGPSDMRKICQTNAEELFRFRAA
jgi:predicted TIM-barrel fold metal-dependent hydrolase